MTTSPPAEPSGSLSANSIQEPHTEPAVNESPSPTPVFHTERTVNMSPGPASPPPNDASVVLLLAEEAKRDSELEVQLKISKLAKPVPDLHLTPAEKLSPVNRLVLRFHQELQDQHGLPVDPAISEQYVMTPWKFGKTWGVRFTESYLARKTLDLLYASQRSDLDCKPFPFARLPLELRMEVYRYALAGDCRRILVWPSDMTICQEDFDSHRIHEGEPWYGDKTHPHWQNPRSHFRSVRIAEGMGINTAILRTSHALHEEAEPFLYQSHEFDFYVDVFGVVPFFRSLSHIARQNIRCLTIHLHHKNGTLNGPNSPLGLVATSRYNLLDWGPACAYIAQNVRLREIMFHTEEEAPEDFQQLSWVQDLTRIKGLRKLTYYELKKPVSLENIDKMGPEDYDRLTTGISVRNQALVTYLKSQMLGFPSTTC